MHFGSNRALSAHDHPCAKSIGFNCGNVNAQRLDCFAKGRGGRVQHAFAAVVIVEPGRGASVPPNEVTLRKCPAGRAYATRPPGSSPQGRTTYTEARRIAARIIYAPSVSAHVRYVTFVDRSHRRIFASLYRLAESIGCATVRILCLATRGHGRRLVL